MHQLIETIANDKLAFSIPSLAEATTLGETGLQKDAQSGKLKTKAIGDGKRIKRIIMREDAIEYLKGLPDGAAASIAAARCA